MDNKEIQYWNKVSVWTLRIMIAFAFILSYLIIAGHIDKLIS